MQRERRARRLAILWALALGWIAVLFFFSGQTGVESGALSGWLTDLVRRILPSIPLAGVQLEHLLRKLAHFGIFAVEGFLLGMAMIASFRDLGVGALLTGVLCTSVAAANELHQSFVDGRSCEGLDMLIDSGGALLGILAATLVCAIVRRRRRKRVA